MTSQLDTLELISITDYLHKPLFDYIKSLSVDSTAPSMTLKRIIEEEAKRFFRLLGENISPRYTVLETACHLCLPNEPEDLSITTAISTVLGSNIFLRCSNIRANSFGYPRGLVFKGKKYPFLKNDFEQNGVFFASRLDRRDFERIRQRLPSQAWEALFDHTVDTLLSADRYWEQIALLNYHLYREITGQRLIFLPLELITSKLFLLNLENHGFFYELFVNRSFRQRVIDYFTNIQGCWGDEGRGTFLFFARNDKNDLVSVKLVGDKLVGVNRDLEINFELSLVTELVANGFLTPSTFTSLALLLFENATLVGGYFQFDYLKKYIDGLRSLSDLEIKHAQNKFGCGFVVHPSFTLDDLLNKTFKFDRTIFHQVTLFQALKHNESTLEKAIKPNNRLYPLLVKLFNSPDKSDDCNEHK